MSEKKIDYTYDSSNKIYYYKEKVELKRKDKSYSINDYYYNYILHNVSGKSVIEGKDLQEEIHIKEGLLHSKNGAAIKFSRLDNKINGHAYYVNGELHSIRPDKIAALEKNNYIIDSNFNISAYAQNGLPIYTENGNIVGTWKDQVVLKMFSKEIFRKEKMVFDNLKQINKNNLDPLELNKIFKIETRYLDVIKKNIATDQSEELIELFKDLTKNYKLSNESDFAFEFKWNNGSVDLDVKIKAINGLLKIDKENPSIIINNQDNRTEYYLEKIETKNENNKIKENYLFIIKKYKQDILKNIKYPSKKGFNVSAEAFHNNGKKSKIIYENNNMNKELKTEVNFDREGKIISFISNENLIKNYNSKGTFKYNDPKLNIIPEKLKEIYNNNILEELFNNKGLYKKEWVDILEVTADIKVPERLILSDNNNLKSTQEKFFKHIEVNQDPKKTIEDLKRNIRNRLNK